MVHGGVCLAREVPRRSELTFPQAPVLPIPEHLGDVKERSEDRDMTLSRRCRAGIAFFATASDDEVDKCVQSCLVAVTEA
jgi:hypothetical protein